jgi:hypothetical protein
VRRTIAVLSSPTGLELQRDDAGRHIARHGLGHQRDDRHVDAHSDASLL